MKIAIGCDEAAYHLKVAIMKHLDTKDNIEYTDFGADEGEVILYPDVAQKVAAAVAAGDFDRGILVCGTGIGMCITANKVPGIRAAVCHDPYSAERSRKMQQRADPVYGRAGHRRRGSQISGGYLAEL